MKSIRTLPTAVIAIALFGLAGAVEAQSFRCGSGIASVGDSKASVLQKCGEPMLKDSFCRAVEAQAGVNPDATEVTVNVVPCETVDEWTYNPGTGRFLTTLGFEQGTLRSIVQGERVK